MYHDECHLQLGVNKAVMPQPLKDYLGKTADKNQYMVAAGDMCGFSTEASAESYHNSNLGSRKQHLFGDKTHTHTHMNSWRQRGCREMQRNDRCRERVREG
jgi:hypothetical protein